MTASKSEQILQHIETLLAGVSEVGGRIYRDRIEALQRTELPALVILPDMETGEYGYTTCRTSWTQLVRILIGVNGGVSTTADPIRVAIHSAITADQTLGGLATYCRVPQGKPAAEWMPEKGDGQPGMLVLSYEISFRTLDSDLTA